VSEANPLDRFVSVRHHLDLFSGIGGFALAAQWAGFETVAFCEIEEFPRNVLEKNFPGVPIHRDIRDLDGSEYAGIDLITGGYPCQPFSTAGHKKGAKDPRHLWPEMRRIIEQARPAWVVAENVTGHITNGLDSVLHDMEGAGYAARPVVIPAGAVGARQRRERIWVIAHAQGNGWIKGRADKGRGREGDAPREEQGPRDVFRDVWELPLETQFRGGVHGIPSRVDRLTALGNAIVPQVAYQILRCIKAH
jgi:DNA (cytosine-5)-methyltransferase 1